MAHSLMRLKGSLINTPHLIEQNSFNSILEYVNKRIEGNVEITKKEMASWDDVDGDYSSRYYEDTKTGFMSIDGPLTYKTSGWEAFCGGTSYEMLKGQMEAFVSYGAKTVAMICDSGGGMAHGMMDSANYIRKLADENGIKIIAYVDGSSCSAAYGISCIADEIIASSDSQTGSVGVLIQLMNNSEHLKQNGFERTFISAGKSKIPFAEDGSFREGFLERLQDSVDELYEGFTAHVASHRGLSVDAVKATEADVFSSKESLELGLIDKIMTPEEFAEYLESYAQSNLEGNEMGNPLKKFMSNNKTDETEMAKLEELQVELTASTEMVTKLATEMSELKGLFEAQASELLAAKEALAEVEKAKAEAIVDQRKAALSEVMPEDQLDAAMAAYGDMPQAAFDFTVSTLKAAKEKVASSEMMSEVGGDGAEQESELDAVDAIKQAQLERAKAMKR